jgi:hypothetical protein
MKSPADLRMLLRRQWYSSARREARLLAAVGAWPIELSIGRSSARQLLNDLDGVKQHIQRWRQISTGQVIWQNLRYKQAAAPIEIPIYWRIARPSDWIEAAADLAIKREFLSLTKLVEAADPVFQSLLIRRRSLWLEKPVEEVQQAVCLALAIEPGMAAGQPLRTLTLAGIDTKFFERHAHLITALLDARFDGEVSRLGLEVFLDAFRECDHWLLVIDLDGQRLPFKKMRVRSSDLKSTELPCQNILIVENESCQHQLPDIPDTIAILGAGFDLAWISNHWMMKKRVAYWGDIDTWGLQFLAKVRTAIPHIQPLLMSQAVFEQYLASAIVERVVAGTRPPKGLTACESQLYQRLLREPFGRLEQEFLPAATVAQAVLEWTNG